MFRPRRVIALAAIIAAFFLVFGDAHARVGGGFSSGSRGMRTFSAPPATQTAPNRAAPINRTVTQQGALFGQATRPGLFGGGLFGSLAAGFLGAGLFGLLFGHGFFGGMVGFASLLGLLFQLFLIYVVARLVMAWWQRRNMPAYAASGPSPGTSASFTANGLGGLFGGNRPEGDPISIVKSDYDTFERLLGDIQAAYSAEDLNALRVRVTPEMLSYFSEQLSHNASRGAVNRVSDVRLLQGDLAEAWRESASEYATVAMRFSLIDRTVDRASGRTIEGGEPQEITELWTFLRARGGNWLLSAIQQT